VTGIDLPAASGSVGRVAAMSIERFQKEVVRGTFMMSQGRQWLQISCLDAIFRILRCEGAEIPWNALESAESRRKMSRRALPPGHVDVVSSHQRESVFLLWLQTALWIGRYVYEGDARHLPTDDELDRHATDLGLEPWMSSSTEEEMCGMKVMFRRYRETDPRAALPAADMIRRNTIRYLIQGDRHWVSGYRQRPGVLPDPHASMLRHLVLDSHDKRRRGWRLTAVERLAARVGDVLADVEAADPDYRTLPTYARLIAEYNAKHPGAEVTCLHR
jgi:hypothetical protein